MNKKIVFQFIALTFLIAVLSWGICTLSGSFGYTVKNAQWLYVFVAFCAFSPTIASYVVLKKNNEVNGFKEWLKNIFTVKCSLRSYLFVLILCVVFLIPQIIFGSEEVQPFYMFFALLPATLIFGGIEEAGWRYVLQPELDKKFRLILSSIIVAVIWASWHILVFLPQGRIESIPWFALFAIDILGQSFALGAIIRITKSVFLCVLFHTLTNAGSGVFNTAETLYGSVLAACLLIVISLLSVFIHEKQRQ